MTTAPAVESNLAVVDCVAVAAVGVADDEPPPGHAAAPFVGEAASFGVSDDAVGQSRPWDSPGLPFAAERKRLAGGDGDAAEVVDSWCSWC